MNLILKMILLFLNEIRQRVNFGNCIC